ncbi:hypothetical protein MLD38_010182 [Melastoma candidum]|uniref:Uncharacterized protein n=1 Tax=Melastoma candidum TaxID=119954 RepID=A0ACB9QZK8_9MYRT|nr:hypothetical protein MLD38_010182 [Melastoma candidum]
MLEQCNGLNGEKYIRKRNRPLTNEELDGMSLHEGYKKLESPVSYVSSGTPARKILASPTPMATPPYVIQQLDVTKEAIGSFPFMKPKGEKDNAPRHFNIVKYPSAPAALVTLYMSIVKENRDFANEAIRYFLDSYRRSGPPKLMQPLFVLDEPDFVHSGLFMELENEEPKGPGVLSEWDYSIWQGNTCFQNNSLDDKGISEEKVLFHGNTSWEEVG